MSLDIYLEELKMTEIFWQNYTHNAGPMWLKAGVFHALYDSDGKKAVEYLAVLREGLKNMESNPDDYRKLNPPNGWGDYDSALEFLRNWLKKCEEFPDAIIRVSR